jgi:hypothetical protein
MVNHVVIEYTSVSFAAVGCSLGLEGGSERDEELRLE